MTILEFIDKYNGLTNEDEKTSLMKTIVKRTYCPIAEKYIVLQKMIDKSVNTEPNGFKYIDMFVSKINYTLALIIMYTSLFIDHDENDENNNSDLNENHVPIYEIYDALTESGLLFKIVNYIGEEEAKELDSVNSLLMENFYNRYGSVSAVVGNAIYNFSQMAGVAAGYVVEELDKTLQDKEKMGKIIKAFKG